MLRSTSAKISALCFVRLFFILIGLRQAKVVDGGPCGVYKPITSKTINRSIRSGLMNSLNFLSTSG